MNMAKMTKTQKKRMVNDIRNKTQKLWVDAASGIVNTADMVAIEKLCAKWMKRIG
jgi:hypothetical protein